MHPLTTNFKKFLFILFSLGHIMNTYSQSTVSIEGTISYQGIRGFMGLRYTVF